MYDTIISDVIIVSKNFDWKPFLGFVCIKDGLISKVGEGSSIEIEAGAKEIINGKGKILMPGLVNCHCHGDMTFAKGLADDTTLLEQINAFACHNWFYNFITDEDRYYARQLAYCEALLSGTTFFCENMYWGLGELSAKAMNECGIKGALVEDIRFDFSNSASLLSDQQLNDFSASCKEAGLVPVIGLPAEEDFETALLGKMFDKCAKVDALQTMHLAENDWRVKIVREKYGTTPIDYLAKNDFLSDKFIGSHVVFATDNEIKLLKKANVKIANTPQCEMKIADGIAAIPQMVKEGLCVGLGTDGALWNNCCDIFAEMKAMSLLHTVTSGIRSLCKTDILDMATTGGASVFALENNIGLIKEGFSADMILIDTENPRMQPLVYGGQRENITSALVYNVPSACVTDVFVNGKKVVENGVLQGLDLPELYSRVHKTAEKVASSM